MNITLWVLQVLLALVFLAHGVMMLAPPAEVAVQMNAMLPRWFQVFLGVAEVLAAVGLTLPGLTRIQPGLVPAAAAGVSGRDGLRDGAAPRARRVQRGGDDVCAAGDGNRRGLRQVAASADCATTNCVADRPRTLTS